MKEKMVEVEGLLTELEARRRRIEYLKSQDGQQRESLSWELYKKGTKDLSMGELFALESEWEVKKRFNKKTQALATLLIMGVMK